MGSITFVGSSKNSGSAGISAPSASPSVPVPSGVAAHDFMLLFAANSAPLAFKSLSGWTSLGSVQDSPTNDVVAQFWWRWASSSEPASYTVSVNSSEAELVGAVMCVYRGVDLSNPIRDSGTVATSSASTTSATPGTLSGVQAGDTVVTGYGYGSNSDNTTTTLNYPSSGGWTQRNSVVSTYQHSTYYPTGMVVVEKVAATDRVTTTASKSGGWGVMNIALAPLATTNRFMPFFGM